MNENETYFLLGLSSIILWYTARFIEAEKFPLTKEQAYSIFYIRKNNYISSPHYTSIVETIKTSNLV